MLHKLPQGAERGLANGIVVSWIVLGLVTFGAPVSRADDGTAVFLRGDANLDGRVGISDGFLILRALYLSEGTVIRCQDAADADDDGSITQIDAFSIFAAIFYRHTPPPAPFPEPGSDPTPDSLSCRQGLGTIQAHALAGDGGGGGDPAFDDGTAEDCDDPAGGADIDFLHFRGVLFVSPGERGVRVPVYLSTAGQIEGITLSFYAPHDLARLEAVDFSSGFLRSGSLRPDWTHTYLGMQDSGYIAGTLVMSLGENWKTIPSVQEGLLGFVEFSVPADVPVGSQFSLAFRTTPGERGYLPIHNEISRLGEAQARYLCGVTVEVVNPSDVFVRGDANRDRRVNIADAVTILCGLFSPTRDGTVRLPCLDAADVDDSGDVSLTDAIVLMGYLFGRGAPPVLPFPAAGPDWTAEDSLDCEQ